MSAFCQDRDILAIEPLVYLTGALPAQDLITGQDGTINGSTFTSATADFQAAGVEAGMVLCVHAGSPAEGAAYEILSVDSQTALTISILRADEDEPAVPPAAASGLAYYVRTFAAQIRRTSEALGERLRHTAEAEGIAAAEFADSSQLAQAAAMGVLAAIFVARAENASPADANWVKAEHYRDGFASLQSQLRLAVDADGDGVAEQTRTLGNVALRRI